jgi:hypothetical protein
LYHYFEVVDLSVIGRGGEDLTMFSRVYDAVFGCWHSRYSFPITVRAGSRRTAANPRTGTYVVCLDCGKELPYDWNEMRVVDAHTKHRAHSLVTKEAA